VVRDYIGFYGTTKVMLLDRVFMERRRRSLSPRRKATTNICESARRV